MSRKRRNLYEKRSAPAGAYRRQHRRDRELHGGRKGRLSRRPADPRRSDPQLRDHRRGSEPIVRCDTQSARRPVAEDHRVPQSLDPRLLERRSTPRVGCNRKRLAAAQSRGEPIAGPALRRRARTNTLSVVMFGNTGPSLMQRCTGLSGRLFAVLALAIVFATPGWAACSGPVADGGARLRLAAAGPEGGVGLTFLGHASFLIGKPPGGRIVPSHNQPVPPPVVPDHVARNNT